MSVFWIKTKLYLRDVGPPDCNVILVLVSSKVQKLLQKARLTTQEEFRNISGSDRYLEPVKHLKWRYLRK